MISLLDNFNCIFNKMPIIAILRGIPLEQVDSIADALLKADIRLIEVPLNTPRAYDCISRLAKLTDDQCVIGAGTVLAVEQIQRVKEAGGKMIISPNFDAGVVSFSVDQGLISLPGVATPTEALGALKLGATGLKVFPAVQVGRAGILAWRSILPKDTKLIGVGGIDLENMRDWKSATCDGVGLGGSLYSPQASAQQVFERAQNFSAKWFSNAT